MTVAEMTPIQLYAVIQCALVVAGIGLLAVSRLHLLPAETGPRVMAGLGLFAIFGLPLIVGFNVMVP